MNDDRTIIEKCLRRIEAKYERKGRAALWTDDTCEEFLRAFALVPASLLPSVVDEVLLNPPKDDRGREINWLPDPSDIVTVARKMCADEGITPSDVVSEILTKVARFGIYGRVDPDNRNCRLEGPPSLSSVAEQAVSAMGGWHALCTMAALDSVVNGLLLKHAQNAVEAEQQRLLLAAKLPKETLPRQIEAPRRFVETEETGERLRDMGAGRIGNGAKREVKRG